MDEKCIKQEVDPEMHEVRKITYVFASFHIQIWNSVL